MSTPSTELAPYSPGAERPRALALLDVPQMLGFAELAVTAGIIGRGQERKEAAAMACMAIAAGAELGLGPMASLRHILVIKGRPAMSAQLIAQRIRGSGRYDYRVRIHTDEASEIELYDRGKIAGVVRWDLERVRRAGLGGEGWARYTRAMLFARAISEAARTFCPDVLGSADLSQEEAHELPAETRSFEGELSEAPEAPAPSAAESEDVAAMRALADDERLPAPAREGLRKMLASGPVTGPMAAKALRKARAMLPGDDKAPEETPA
jgi:hypothetical protein